ncbi:MAG TPA: O-antigen ligase family protein [Candidatus Limnocylindria bacterium]|nr:O-antigen ligase family protein [Candidatus Limnocylindria bacterium]
MTSERPDAGVVVGVLAFALAAWAAFSIWGLPALMGFVVVAVLLTPFSPEMATLLGIAAIYLNLPGIAVKLHDLPPTLAASTSLLLLAPFLVRVLLRRETLRLDVPFLLILAFLGAVLLSLFGIEDEAAATRWVTTFLTEGLVVYFLVLNLFRTPESIRRAIYILIFCGAILGGLTLYQEATRSYTQQFSGLAQRNISYGTGDELLREKDLLRQEHKIHLRERAAGPLGDPNRYAQILVVLMPLAYFTLKIRRELWSRIVTVGCGLLILIGALLTYSRGGFIGIVAQIAVLKGMGAVRFRALGLFLVAAVIAVFVLAPGYPVRLDTLRGVSFITSQTRGQESEAVFRGRLTEMLAAFNVFLDHPLTGVGPGQFLPVYSTSYMSNPEIAFRRITEVRRAHTLYFELAAETGILGLVTFFGAVGLIQVRLWSAWRRWRRRNRPELAGLAGAFFLAILGYLVTGVFLHLAFQRYYWLLLGLAGATLQVLSDEDWRFVKGEAGSAKRAAA